MKISERLARNVESKFICYDHKTCPGATTPFLVEDIKMANWTGPVHLPKFTKKEFEEKKRKYNEKYGYTITLPAFDQVIHVNMPHPMTPEEISLWKQRKYDEIPPARLETIRRVKTQKKAKFLAMMGSPAPKIVRSAGAIMTALDDLQDAVSTLACVGMLVAAVAGGTTAAVLAGPLGWVVGASAILNMINPFSRMKGPKFKPYTGMSAKRDAEDLTKKNPFTKKARVRVAKKIKSFKMGTGNYVEALQVTDNIFGVGVCLGPIVGLAVDLISGGVYKLFGKKVGFATMPAAVPTHITKAGRAAIANAVFHGYLHKTDFNDEINSLFAANLAMQALEPYLPEWSEVMETEDLASYEMQAPRPTDILTLEIIEEAGYTLDEVCNWPQNGEQFISLGELAETTAPIAAENLRHFAEKNKNSALAFIAGQNAHDFALHSLAAWEGDDQVEIEYLPTSRIVITILKRGWCYPEDVTDAQVQKFEDWVYVHEYMGTVPTGKEIQRYAEVFCEFSWAKSEDDYR